MDNEVIGKNLAALREKCGLSQDEVADIVGLSRGTLSNLENGKTDTLMRYSRHLAEIYKCSEWEIISGNKGDYNTSLGDDPLTVEKLIAENKELRSQIEELKKDKDALRENIRFKDELIEHLQSLVR